MAAHRRQALPCPDVLSSPAFERAFALAYSAWRARLCEDSFDGVPRAPDSCTSLARELGLQLQAHIEELAVSL